MATVEQKLLEAGHANDVAEVKRILERNLDVNVNWEEGPGWPVLLTASDDGHSEVVKLLLARKDIHVNLQRAYSSMNRAALHHACNRGHIEVAKLLLADLRVDATLTSELGFTPLHDACNNGHLHVVKWLIASGKDLNHKATAKYWDYTKDPAVRRERTAMETAVHLEYSEIGSLLQRFENDQEKTRHEVRIELGLHGDLVAELFALTVFLCDDFFDCE